MSIYHLLLDVGGTGIKGAGFGGDSPALSRVLEFPSRADAGREELLAHFRAIAELLWAEIPGERTPGALAMAFPGPFDYARGMPLLKGLAKYESLYGVSLPDELKRLGFSPMVFENDISAFARGAIARHSLNGRAMFLCVGTGAGSAFSVGGKIKTDPAEGIPENGWVYPLPFGKSVVDDYLSARGVSRLAEEHCGTPLTPLELSERAHGGDSRAVAAYAAFGENLRRAMLPVLDRFRADSFVLGGKIGRSARLFLDPLEQECEERGIGITIETETSLRALEGLAQILSTRT